MPITFLKNASLAFGLHHLLDHADFVMDSGQRIALIGRNGAGKSSLVSVLAGKQTLDDGEIWVAPHLRIAIAQQIEFFDVHKTIKEIIVDAITGCFDEWDYAYHAAMACEIFSLDPDRTSQNLSGGEKKRLALACAFAKKPDLLVLDEPTNHLDIATIEQLELRLKNFQGAILLISHDRAFIDALAESIVELDRGALRTYPGNYQAYQKRKAEELESEAVTNAKFDKFLAEEEVWIRQGIEARRTRNEGRVRRLEQLRLQRANRREVEKQSRFSIEDSQRSGKLVYEFTDVTKAFKEKTVIRSFSGRIMRGEKVGLIGPNGAGKSTLLKLMLGELTADHGKIERGTNLSVAYFDQERAQLDDQATLIETITPGGEMIDIGGRQQHVITYLGDFLFSPQRARAKVGSLSGGERNRLLLARLFSRPVNLLVLDEPTNDLDIDTLEMLEDQLLRYEGTVIIVSHDRTFLDNITTQLIATEGDGNWECVVGGYREWKQIVEKRQQERKQLAASSEKTEKARPARNREEKLSFNEKRALEVLPDEISALETSQAELVAQLNDPALYKESPEAVSGLRLQLADIEAQIEEKTETWLLLEEKAARTEKV